MLYLFIFLSIVFCSEKSVYVKTPSSITDIGDYPYPNDPMADRAKGYLLSGKAHTATSNYGLYSSWQNFPGGLWGEYTYLPNIALMAGVRGHRYSSDFIWSPLPGESSIQTWCSEDLYQDWDLNPEDLPQDGIRVNGNFIGIVFETYDDRGTVGTRYPNLNFSDINQWAFDVDNERVCISLENSNPNLSNAMVGVMYPWALRPALIERLETFDYYDYGPDGAEYTDDDGYMYYGSTVSESWFTRWNPSINTDWQASSGSMQNSHNQDYTVGDLFGDTYVTHYGDSYPVLAHSNFPITWPMDGYDDSFWPGWLDVDDSFTADTDIFMVFDDRWAFRGNMIDENNEYLQTGYPIGLEVETQIYSYAVPYLEDVIIFDSRISNQSHDMIMADGTKLVSGEGFNYKDLTLGFYFDADVLSVAMNGSYAFHTNEDDMMEFIDCATNLEYYPNGCPVINGEQIRVSMAVVGDWDGYSGMALGYSMDPNSPSMGDDFGLVAVQLLDTPIATDPIDLDDDGFIDIYPGEELKMTDWHWFDWYTRPGVAFNEGSGACCAGDPDTPQALNKEEIMYKIMAGDTTNISEDEQSWFFHADPFLDQYDPNFNPHFDNYEDIIQTEYFQSGSPGLDAVMIMSSGPFGLNINEQTKLTFALIFGRDHQDLLANAEMTQLLYRNNYLTYSAPTPPNLTLTESPESLMLEWDNVSESSVDDFTGLQDFQGYRVYRSLDGGMTWGDEGDMIFNDDGAHVGWIPYVQFDYSLEEDMDNYGQEINGADSVNPWFSLGSDTGLEYTLVDEEVVPYHEYCYAVTAYDTGIIGDLPGAFPFNPGSIESSISNMICGSQSVDFYADNFVMESTDNSGWSIADYILMDNESLNKYFQAEIQASVDGGSWTGVAVNNPLLYFYETDSLSNPVEFSQLVDSYALLDSISDLPGVQIIDEFHSDTEFLYTIPNYVGIGTLGDWIDVDGVFLNINGLDENYFISNMNNLLPQDIIWDSEVSDEDLSIIDFSLAYSSFGLIQDKPYFDYNIEFGELGIDTASIVTPSSSCDGTNTLLPFKITNINTGNKVNLLHFDQGADAEGSPGNPIEGYANCQWDSREPLRFKEIGVDFSDIDDDEWTYQLTIDWDIENFGESLAQSSVDIITPKLLHDGDSWKINDGTGIILSNELVGGELPKTFVLENPYPNPFNPMTTIKFFVPYASKLKFEVYDISGRKIKQFNENYYTPGYHSVIWDAGKHSSGIYFVRMVADGFSSTQKVMLVK